MIHKHIYPDDILSINTPQTHIVFHIFIVYGTSIIFLSSRGILLWYFYTLLNPAVSSWAPCENMINRLHGWTIFRHFLYPVNKIEQNNAMYEWISPQFPSRVDEVFGGQYISIGCNVICAYMYSRIYLSNRVLSSDLLSIHVVADIDLKRDHMHTMDSIVPSMICNVISERAINLN